MGVKWKHMSASKRRMFESIADKMPIPQETRDRMKAGLAKTGSVYRVKTTSLGKQIGGGLRKLATRPESLLFGLLLGGMGLGLKLPWWKSALAGGTTGYASQWDVLSAKARRALGAFSGGVGVGSLLRFKGRWKRHGVKSMMSVVNPVVGDAMNSRDWIGLASPVARVLIDSLERFMPSLPF